MNPVLQRDAARERANHFRTVQAIFKRNVAGQSMDVGLRLVREAIADPPVELSGLRVEKVLMAVRAVGIEKANAYLRKAHLSPNRKLRDLTDNERARLELVLR